MTTLTPTGGGGRRNPLPVVVAVVVALAVGVAAGWWWSGRESSGAASPGPSTSCSSHASASGAKVAKLPDPRTIKVNVYNATNRRGLAKATSLEMSSRGFLVASAANDPLKKTIAAPAEVRSGKAGARAALVVGAQVPTPVYVVDNRKDASVDLVLGEGFTALNTTAQAQALLTAKPSPSVSAC